MFTMETGNVRHLLVGAVEEVREPWCGTFRTVAAGEGPGTAAIPASAFFSMSPLNKKVCRPSETRKTME